MEVVSIAVEARVDSFWTVVGHQPFFNRKHETEAVVRATVMKFSESNTQVKEVMQSPGLEVKMQEAEVGIMKYGTEGKEQDTVIYNFDKPN